MLRLSRALRKVVDHNSKEGKEFMLAKLRYTRIKNQSFYAFCFVPLFYVPYHYYVNEPQLWQNYVNPYAMEEGDATVNATTGRSETLREKRAREAAERAAAATASASTDIAGSAPAVASAEEVAQPRLAPKPAHGGGSSLWLRGGSFKDSLNVKPKREGQAEGASDETKQA